MSPSGVRWGGEEDVQRIRKIFDIKVLRMELLGEIPIMIVIIILDAAAVCRVLGMCGGRVGGAAMRAYLLGDFTSSTRSSNEYFIGVVVETEDAWRRRGSADHVASGAMAGEEREKLTILCLSYEYWTNRAAASLFHAVPAPVDDDMHGMGELKRGRNDKKLSTD